MKIVIELNEELYDYMKSLPHHTILENIVLNGTPLKEEHPIEHQIKTEEFEYLLKTAIKLLGDENFSLTKCKEFNDGYLKGLIYTLGLWEKYKRKVR